MTTVANKVRVAGKLVIDGVTDITYDSAVTMIGLQTVASCLGSPFNFDRPWMPFIGVGQGENAPSTEDKHLENEKYRKRGVVTATDKIYKVFARFEEWEPEDDYILREVGIFDKIAGGRMAARFVLDYDIDIDEEDILEVTVYIYIEQEPAITQDVG